MYNYLSSFGFDLNNREIATLSYLALLPVIAIYKGFVTSLGDVARAFFNPKFAAVWLIMSLYVTTCVWLLAKLDLWDWPNLKSTLVWWLTVGFSSFFDAKRFINDRKIIRKLLRDTLTLSAVITFIAELVSFPLWVEFLLFPILALVTLLLAVGDSLRDDPKFHRLLSFLRRLQILAGLIMLGSSYWMVANTVGEHWTVNTLREFGLPLLLWLMFIPFIILLATYMSYETSFIQLARRPKQEAIYGYAKRRAIIAFGWNSEGVRRLIRDIIARDVDDKNGVKEAIDEIKKSFKIEKKPLPVRSADGWSPQEARYFLGEFDMVTDDYHRNQWEWFASKSLKLKNAPLADQISYYITGKQQAVTRLRLALNGSNQNNVFEAERFFDERAMVLLTKIFDAKHATEILRHPQDVTLIDETTVSISRSEYGSAVNGGYNRNLVIEHKTHKEDGL
ncbi:hypothetical protein IB237_23905 [Agrobacterium sp. AGB01]|uniref:hypothetical protein n=1 Tax=Agrobacterium sp. AGB01 TaxID=2769302 RepID=UPI00178528B3|nr:hypothetical protein [Agrobacterium sp. AGB01]MBD9390249.1 hypothetical protein [Agrobacterium sp. AGB01]